MSVLAIVCILLLFAVLISAGPLLESLFDRLRPRSGRGPGGGGPS